MPRPSRTPPLWRRIQACVPRCFPPASSSTPAPISWSTYTRNSTSNTSPLHSAQDMGALVRDYVKWDDQPYSLGHFAESSVRAYNIAMTPPMGPVLITCNAELQLHPNTQTNLRIPTLSRTAPPQGDAVAVAQAAKWLVDAQSPA